MKKYKIIILAFTAMISFSSCSDFLTTELTDAKKTTDNYYKTPSEAYTALVGCYNGLDLIWNAGVSFPLASEVLSDNCFGGTGASDDYKYQKIDQFDKSIAESFVSVYAENWQAYYQAIYRCNVLLAKLDQVTWGDSIALKTQYKAEAKFIRAYLYFDLARLFEKVPLLTVASTENTAQAEPAETYAQIMTDLRFASDSLPSITYSNTTNGRVTKWAAESMLARVYLFYTGYYGATEIGGETKATALAALEDVIAHSGHGLVTDFTTLWPAASTAKGVTYAGEDNKEVVFSIKYTITGDYNGNVCGNTWLVMTGLREQNSYPYGKGWGACTVDPKLWSTFLATDARRFASITNVSTDATSFTNSTANREYTGYYLKKYSPECLADGTSKAVSLGGTDFMIGQYQDYFVIRYADVLLMAAELGSTNAASYYNLVHQRAIPTATAVSSVTTADILAERRLEFVGEGIRYWDLLRQGLSTAAATIVANTTTSYLEDGTAAPALSASNITLTRGFQQIPNSEITLSGGVLKQNAGW
jgi:starch-binding outer membrane protein, SusD/RagB family